MEQIRARNNDILYQLSALFIAGLFFILGRFGFFDILGLKRLFEFVLFTPIAVIGILFILKKPNLCSNPYFLLPCVYFVLQCLNPNWLVLADLAGTILITGVILALGPRFSDLLLKYLILFSAFFACLGMIEFLILLINPNLVKYILLFYDSYSGSTLPMIENGWQLLGLSDGTTYHLFGMSVTRLRSFSSEPSLLVGYFLVPGALGLTYHGKYKLAGMACIVFCLMSLAGSVYAALGLSALSLILILFGSQRLMKIAPFIFLGIFIWVLFNHYNELIMATKSSGSGGDFLDKTHSANMRFSYIRDLIPVVFTSPWGMREEITQPLGLVIGSMARGGIAGLLLMMMILWKLYTWLSELLVNCRLGVLPKIGVLILYGSLTTGILYLDNCFIQSFGFLLLLIDHRLRAILR